MFVDPSYLFVNCLFVFFTNNSYYVYLFPTDLSRALCQE